MLEILVIFMASVGLLLLCWCLMGLLLLPVFGHNIVTLCFSEGHGGKLEQQVRAYGWLRDGRLSGGRFVIVDCGLAPTGIDCALTLQKDHDWVEYCSHEMLEEHLNSMKIRNANHSVP